MAIWHEFPLSAIDAYLKDFIGSEAPVFWELATEIAADMPERLERALAGYTGIAMRRRTDSLALEIDFPRDYRDMVTRREANPLAAVAALEDEGRALAAPTEPLASGVLSELETEVPSGADANRRLPAIGPGGRAVAFQRTGGIAADVVIRRRLRGVPGTWRWHYDILRRLWCDCPETPPAFRVRAAFGYFELSKYEPQHLLRPVFLFSLEQAQDENGRWPGWMTTLVEPATTAPGIALDDGLGLWSE